VLVINRSILRVAVHGDGARRKQDAYLSRSFARLQQTKRSLVNSLMLCLARLCVSHIRSFVSTPWGTVMRTIRDGTFRCFASGKLQLDRFMQLYNNYTCYSERSVFQVHCSSHVTRSKMKAKREKIGDRSKCHSQLAQQAGNVHACLVLRHSIL